MLIKSENKYIPSLINLWHEVFGDDEDYIRLFFKEAYFDSECFAEIIDGEIVSALYLLKSDIKYGGKIYHGRYLYAAATLPSHRGKGIMSELIGEAAEYAHSQSLDFIALVPASDSLYDYYGKFGYKQAMYKYRLEISREGASFRAFRELESADKFYQIRNSSADDMLIYGKVGCRYAFECLGYSGKKMISIDEKSYYISGEELFLAADDYVNSAETYFSSLSGEKTLFCNRPLALSQKVKNGMVYPINSELENKEIYMNIALD